MSISISIFFDLFWIEFDQFLIQRLKKVKFNQKDDFNVNLKNEKVKFNQKSWYISTFLCQFYWLFGLINIANKIGFVTTIRIQTTNSDLKIQLKDNLNLIPFEI